MNSTNGANAMAAPRLSAVEIRRMLEAELSLKARIGYTLLLLFDLGVGGAIASLWATETDLPARTQAAFAVMVAIAIAWAVFFIWTLARRKVLLARHRVISSRLAIAFTAVYTMGALLLAMLHDDVRASGLYAAGFGAVMLGAAGILLVRANRKLAHLIARKRALEEAIAEARV